MHNIIDANRFFKTIPDLTGIEWFLNDIDDVVGLMPFLGNLRGGKSMST
ncbi:MAG: hypothetical protein KAX28_11680 [Candidatus Marinimicrobia bacterium]|nr:hypothetical protein [Candidatus Neomarinimicrobiota bacterium]